MQPTKQSNLALLASVTLSLATTGSAAPTFTSSLATSRGATKRDASNGAGNGRFESLVVFGDSFSDDGNGAWVVSNHTWPANPNYANHTFSNGPVWPVNVASNLSIALYDYAIGGATTDNDLVQGYTGPSSTIAVPSVLDQIQNYTSSPPAGINPDTTLYALFGGANDILFNSNISAAQSMTALVSGISTLQSSLGASNFLLLNYPDIGHLPYDYFLNSTAVKEQYSSYSTDLGVMLRGLSDEMTGIAYVDLVPLFDEFGYYASPEKYGYDKLGKYGSCLVGVYMETENVTVCDDAEKRVFWDEYHPSGHSHRLIAEKVIKEIGGPFA